MLYYVGKIFSACLNISTNACNHFYKHLFKNVKKVDVSFLLKCGLSCCCVCLWIIWRKGYIGVVYGQCVQWLQNIRNRLRLCLWDEDKPAAVCRPARDQVINRQPTSEHDSHKNYVQVLERRKKEDDELCRKRREEDEERSRKRKLEDDEYGRKRADNDAGYSKIKGNEHYNNKTEEILCETEKKTLEQVRKHEDEDYEARVNELRKARKIAEEEDRIYEERQRIREREYNKRRRMAHMGVVHIERTGRYINKDGTTTGEAEEADQQRRQEDEDRERRRLDDEARRERERERDREERLRRNREEDEKREYNKRRECRLEEMRLEREERERRKEEENERQEQERRRKCEDQLEIDERQHKQWMRERYDKALKERDNALIRERELELQQTRLKNRKAMDLFMETPQLNKHGVNVGTAKATLKLQKRRLQKDRENLTMITPVVKSDGTLSGTFNMEYEGPKQWDPMTQATKASHSVATSGTTRLHLPKHEFQQFDGTARSKESEQCTVKIPKGACPPDANPVITMVLNENPQDNDHRITPILKCEPDGLKFTQPVEITLPTCFRYMGDLPMEATVRHKSEHGQWKVLTKLSMDRNTKSFTFCTNHFSQFDVVIVAAQIYCGLVKEKAMMVAVPPREDEEVFELVASVIICDNIGPAKQLVANLNNVYETTFVMRSRENIHRIQVEGEDICVDPQHDMVSGAWHRSKDVTQFRMTCARNLKQGTTQLHILLNSVAPNEVKVDKRFYLESHHFNPPPPQDTNIKAGVLIITS